MKRACLLLVLLAGLPVLGDTPVSGTIGTNTTWTQAGSPYILSGDVTVGSAAGATLTIQPGVVVKGNSSARLSVNTSNRGTLIVNGTEALPVLFTANSASPVAGFWRGVRFGSVAGAAPSSMSWSTVEYAGSSFNFRGAVVVEGTAPSLLHVTSRTSQYAGIQILGGSPSLTSCAVTGTTGAGVVLNDGSVALNDIVLTGNTGAAIDAPAAAQLLGMTGLAATGNGTNGVRLSGGVIGASRTWKRSAIPYFVVGTINVQGAAAPVLTIEAGNTVRFSAGTALTANVSAAGGLVADGTLSEPILFTSNGPAVAGHWFGLRLGNAAGGPASSLSHATVEYAGDSFNLRGGLTLSQGVLALDRLTVRNCEFAGIRIESGSPSISNSTVAGNGGPGIQFTSGSATLNGIALSGNTGAAISAPAATQLMGMSGLSATGNGTNGVLLSAGTIAANRTWRRSAIPYVIAGTITVAGAAAPVLTIEPGNTIRFAANTSLAVNVGAAGGLVANGTASEPIVFTSTGATTAGSWDGIRIGNEGGAPPSSISYATIEYGGDNFSFWGGLTVFGPAPVLDHLAIRNNAHAGLRIHGSAVVSITNSSFSGNAAGAVKESAARLTAALNYWSSENGPCLSGCTAGQQSVSSGVSYEPWLTSPATDPLFLTSAVVTNRAFSPAIGAKMSIVVSSSIPGDTTMTIRSAAGTVVRTITVSGTPGTLVWNGANDAGVTQPDGTYTYELAATANSEASERGGEAPIAAAIARGRSIVDSTRVLTLTAPVVSPVYFSPDGDGVQDTTTITATTNYDDSQWTVTVLDAGNNLVTSHNGAGAAVSFTWDGRSSAGVLQPDGVYTLRIDAIEGISTAQRSAVATLDDTAPVAALSAPNANSVFSNVYGNGASQVVTGTATDANLLSWALEYGLGAAPSTWTQIASGASPVSSATLGNWATANLANGTYTIRLRVTDRAGTVATATRTPLTVGHFKVTQSAYQFNAASGGTITYTSTVPFALTESLVVKNESGEVVRTLVSGPRAAGTYADVFNGRRDAGALLPDGPYFYLATVTDGVHTLVWDLSQTFRTDYNGQNNDNINIAAYDPFNNTPMKFNYNFSNSGRVTIVVSTTDVFHIIGNCAQPTETFFCLADGIWEESGPKTFTWSGIDPWGNYRSIRDLGIRKSANRFPVNAAVLYGTKPVLQNVKVTPPVFGPAAGIQTVEFDFTTHQSLPAVVQVDFVNVASKATLRVLWVEGQQPGHVAFAWDGRAYDGTYVAPGVYQVVVTVADSIGNVVKGDILTTIQY